MIIVIVELKCYHNIKDTKQQAITITEGSGGPKSGNFCCLNVLVSSLVIL